MFEIYKRGQGRYVRISTFVAAMVLIVAGAWVLSSFLSGYIVTRPALIRFGAPTLLAAALALLAFRMVNRPKSADFLIGTEGEMKKVSWSSRKEVIGSTKVVIVTALILASLLFGVDYVFSKFFRWIGVMGR
ncbi:MAG: preprotein translocase subunit SecE [Phycisphaerae bacterium]|jgi:preprotein translocase subunit SecE|nr:preprotein translocase subunit SecE [Phycisphaerae bacterium]